MPPTPEMSVIVLTPDGFAAIRRLMAHLRAQTARARLELVFVAPDAGRLQADETELAGFAAVRVVEADVMRSTAEARAAGVRAAAAPIIAFTEDHCFPEPGWAEALIRAHGEPWAAVGPAVLNANPRSAVSWANLLTEYVEWLRPIASTAWRVLEDPLGLDLRVAAIPQNIAVLRKLSDDTRSWRMRRRMPVS